MRETGPLDSNPGMARPKPAALPLGDGPLFRAVPYTDGAPASNSHTQPAHLRQSLSQVTTFTSWVGGNPKPAMVSLPEHIAAQPVAADKIRLHAADLLLRGSSSTGRPSGITTRSTARTSSRPASSSSCPPGEHCIERQYIPAQEQSFQSPLHLGRPSDLITESAPAPVPGSAGWAVAPGPGER